jgi:N-acetylglucosamine-6-phosphate deacetylase
MNDLKIYIAAKTFTGQDWLENHAVLVRNNIIEEVRPSNEITGHAEKIRGMLVPAFIDLQIYGAYGKLLAVYPETGTLYKLHEYCRKGGAALCQPTVATNTNETILACIKAVKAYWKEGGKGILGLHIEGPWINKIKRGAHAEEWVHAPSFGEVKDLLEAGKGVITMITLAPELCSKEIIELVLSYGIKISAGHSNAGYDEAKDSFNNGITAVTHLYNAMSPLQHRSPGLVGATMDDNTVMASIIPDGHHINYAALRIAKSVMKERLFAITDAVTETSEGYYRHQLKGDKYEAGGILSGSALTMNKALFNLVHHCNIELAEALRMCSLYPARVMGLDHQQGKIEKDSWH